MALVLLIGDGRTVGARTAAAVAAVLALALGMQNAVVRRLGVLDLTTTVLTMTITGIAADLRSGGVVTVARRLLAVATMLAGAVVGTLLDLHQGPPWALLLAVALTVVVAASAVVADRRSAVPN